MALEHTVKELQAKNAQFQQMFLALAKGREELKALVIKDKKLVLKYLLCNDMYDMLMRCSQGSRGINTRRC